MSDNRILTKNMRAYYRYFVRLAKDAGELDDGQLAKLAAIDFDSRNADKAIICLETGETYESQADAASKIGCSSSQMSNSCCHGFPVYGKHYARIDELDDYTPKRPRRRPVLCIETGETFESMCAAARALDKPNGGSSIFAAVSQNIAAYGFHWRYADETEHAVKTADNRTSDFNAKLKPSVRKPAMCIETGKVFESRKAAGIAYGDTSGVLVSQAIRTKGTAYGLHWCNPDDVPNIEDIEPPRTYRTVVCHETGKTYRGVKEAAEAYNLASPCISRAIKHLTASGGVHWYYLDSPPNPSQFKKPLCQPIRCIETGEVFPTIKEAAEHIGVCASSLHRAMSKRSTCRGLHWERISADEQHTT